MDKNERIAKWESARASIQERLSDNYAGVADQGLIASMRSYDREMLKEADGFLKLYRN